MARIILLFLITLFAANEAVAQSAQDLYYKDESGRDALFKPRLGAGVGMFTYFGDVNDNNYNHPFTSSLGYEIVASANINRYFNLDLKTFYGVLKVNERTTERHLNFRSEIFVGGVGVTYNFNHLYRKPGIIQPFVTLGAAYMHFDSKSDMLDASGNAYHYWDNGSIRNIAQDDPAADASVEVQRDYNYETDLRQANLDGLGKYSRSTFAIPVSLGLDFRLSRRFSAKFSSTFYYTLTDNIDNVSDAGEGLRKGNSGNDMFLFTSMSVSYALGVKQESVASNRTNYYSGSNFTALYFEDSDGDGVNDFDDMCANTPKGVAVDEMGCPLDDDQDVIENYRDEEDSTSTSMIANTDGVGMTDQMMLDAYADSAALKRSHIHLVYPSGVLSARPELSPEDSVRLSGAKSQIRSMVESNSDLNTVFDRIDDAVMKLNFEEARDVETVFKKADEVYSKLVKEKAIKPNKPFAISKDPIESSPIPPQYQEADYNNDGLITSEEILRIIDMVLDGEGPYTVQQVYNLIDYFTEYMEDARVVDFGGTLGTYIDGTLHIVDANTANANSTQRYLAKRYGGADLNGDGILTADEVNQMIALFQAGDKTYSEEQILELIDLYFED